MNEPPTKKQRTARRPQKENGVTNGNGATKTVPFQGFENLALNESTTAVPSAALTKPPATNTPKLDELAMGCGGTLDLSSKVKEEEIEDGVAQQDLNAAKMTLQRDGLNAYAAECFYGYYQYCNDYRFPPWLRPDGLRDLDGRPPTDIRYDQSTLWVPSEAVMKEER